MSAVASHAEPTRGRTPGYHPLVIVLVAAAVGIVVDRYRPLSIGVCWSVAAAGLAGWFMLRRKEWPVALMALVLLAVAGLAAAWHHDRWNLFGRDDVALFATSLRQPVAVELVALQSPRVIPPPPFHPLGGGREGDEVRLEVEVRAIRDRAEWRPASGRAWLTVAARLPNVLAGDRLRAFVHLEQVEPAMNPGEFDRRERDRGDRIGALLRTSYAESITRVQSGFDLHPRRLLERLRQAADATFRKHLQPQQAALADAGLLGLREQVDPDEMSAFQETGTIHLLVIAGLHLGILAGAASIVLRRVLPGQSGLLAVGAFTVLYMMLVDAEPPVVRATILIVATCVAMYVGRRRAGLNVLALAAIVVLAMNPSDLFRVGPQLSFLCVAGLTVLGPQWIYAPRPPDPLAIVQSGDAEERRWQRPIYIWLRKHVFWNYYPGPIERLMAAERPWPARILSHIGRGLRYLTLVSGTIWLLTVPLVMAAFHIFNPIAVLVNAAVWFPMAAALVSGLAMLICSLLPGPLVHLCAWVCNHAIGAVEWIVQFGRSVPLGHIWVPGPAVWWLIGFYLALGGLAAFPMLCRSWRWRLALLGAWTACGVLIPWWTTDRHGLRCTFLSVGHGEAVVLELPSGKTILYDAGRISAPTSCCRIVSGYLWSRGLTHIDAVLLSHADTDHYNGLPGLLQRFSVGVVYVSPVMFDEDTAGIRYLKESIDRAKVPIRVIASGDRLAGGPECSLAVLHPPPRGLPATSNANSIVMTVECQGRRILLPADLQSPGLDDVLAERPLPCDVLLVPHHGSVSSKPAQLAAWSTPRWAVFSADHRYNTSGVEAVYGKFGRTCHTADTGAVMARIDKQALKVETFLGEKGRATQKGQIDFSAGDLE